MCVALHSDRECRFPCFIDNAMSHFIDLHVMSQAFYYSGIHHHEHVDLSLDLILILYILVSTYNNYDSIDISANISWFGSETHTLSSYN